MGQSVPSPSVKGARQPNTLTIVQYSYLCQCHRAIRDMNSQLGFDKLKANEVLCITMLGISTLNGRFLSNQCYPFFFAQCSYKIHRNHSLTQSILKMSLLVINHGRFLFFKKCFQPRIKSYLKLNIELLVYGN